MISCSIIPPHRRNYRAWLIAAVVLVGAMSMLGHVLEYRDAQRSRLDVGRCGEVRR